MPHRIAVVALLAFAAGSAAAQDVAGWAPLGTRFESTGGGGIVIDGYRPVVIGDRCVTGFTATTPASEVYPNYGIFEATPLAGGMLCRDGRWGTMDGSATDTTPLVVWLKDGVMHRAPPVSPAD